MRAKLHYSRYYSPGVMECDSVSDAARVAIRDQDYGEIYALKIEDGNGAIAWERTGPPWANNDDHERLEKLAGLAHEHEWIDVSTIKQGPGSEFVCCVEDCGARKDGTGRELCPVCGKGRRDGWDDCSMCGHKYPERG